MQIEPHGELLEDWCFWQKCLRGRTNDESIEMMYPPLVQSTKKLLFNFSGWAGSNPGRPSLQLFQRRQSSNNSPWGFICIISNYNNKGFFSRNLLGDFFYILYFSGHQMGLTPQVWHIVGKLISVAIRSNCHIFHFSSKMHLNNASNLKKIKIPTKNRFFMDWTNGGYIIFMDSSTVWPPKQLCWRHQPMITHK